MLPTWILQSFSYLVSLLLVSSIVSTFLRRYFSFALVGLTGSIATGKSTACKQLRRLNRKGIRVIDFDKLGHEVLSPGNTAWTAVKKEFGDVVLKSDWRVDRKIL